MVDATKRTDIIRITYHLLPSDIDLFKNNPKPSADKTMNRKLYHSKMIQQKARISSSQIIHWTRTGVIIPFQTVRGTGRMHVYDHQNLLEAMICRELSQYSINHRIMSEVLDYLKNKKWVFDIYFSIGDVQDISSHDDDMFVQYITEFQIPDHKIVDKPFKYRDLWDVRKRDFEPERRRHTIWDFFKYYPQKGICEVYLVLCKELTRNETEKSINDYQIYVATNTIIKDMLSQSISAIAINLSLLLNQAGDFFEEVEN